MGTKETLDESFSRLMGEAARAIGTDHFYLDLLSALKLLVPWNAADIVRWSRYAAPDFLHVEGLSTEMLERYRAGYYRFDPFFRWWRDVGEGGVLTLRGICRPMDLAGNYFTEFFPTVEMKDVIGLHMPSIAGTAVALYLESASRHYSPAQVERVSAVYPLFLGLHDAHIARMFADLRHGIDAPAVDRAIAVIDRDQRQVFTSPAWQAAEAGHPPLRDPAALARSIARPGRLATPIGPVNADALAADSALAPGGTILVLERAEPALPPIDFDGVFKVFAEGRLTPRETQIARLMLSGYPTEAIAKSLGIGRGTVKNHRRRLYDRLDITTERELFSLFMEFLARPQTAMTQ